MIKNYSCFILLFFSCSFLKAQKLSISGIYINSEFQNLSLDFELPPYKYGNYSCYYQSYFSVYPKAPQSLSLYRNNELSKKLIFGYGLSVWNKTSSDNKQNLYLTPTLKLSWEKELSSKIKIRGELFENAFVNALNHQVYIYPVIFKVTNKFNAGIKLGTLYSHTYNFKSIYWSPVVNATASYSF
ncbi:MAG: hypothetical protein WBP45_01240 [Daejeonella sp.]